MTGDDSALDPPVFEDPPLLGGDGMLGDQDLRPFVLALGGLLVAVAVVTLLMLLARLLGLRPAHERPAPAEVSEVARRWPRRGLRP